MILYPAIDIYNGQCVRLLQGDFEKSTVYDKNPVDAAKRWADQGATWLHVVDLNGAKEGRPINLKIIEEIMTTIPLPVQIGGGIRNQETAEILLTLGAGRVVLGSAAVEDSDLVQILCLKYEGRIAVSIDAREGRVAVHGWKDLSTHDPMEMAQQLGKVGVDHIIYTDISRDGTLQGLNWASLEKMAGLLGSAMIVSGGVHSLEDLTKIKKMGAGGAILGRSLYEKRIQLKEALPLC